jgi:site-specific DNA-methyltransferase (adenine-specific)
MGAVPFYVDESVTLFQGDCRAVMASLPDRSVDSIVTDPPYELGFMGKGWDGSGIAYNSEVWENAYRVLKPGGHLLAFGGTRTWHRLAVAIEDAGFEVRDSIAWMYGSGFPKSLDVSKAIDKAAGAERDRVAYSGGIASGSSNYGGGGVVHVGTKVGDTPATPAAQQWQGWGTALKPAFEPIVVARKPLIGTVAENVLAHGTGGLNIDGCRIGTDGERPTGLKKNGARSQKVSEGWDRPWKNDDRADRVVGDGERTTNAGRWPANVILDESQAAELDKQSGVLTSGANPTSRSSDKFRNAYGDFTGQTQCVPARGIDTGGASRFFYCAKANSSERPRDGDTAHPTVKPLELMQYLIKLVTPPGGTVLEPFAGSGTTLEACIIEGFKCIGIELTPEYLPLIVQRVTKPIEVTLL